MDADGCGWMRIDGDAYALAGRRCRCNDRTVIQMSWQDGDTYAMAGQRLKRDECWTRAQVKGVACATISNDELTPHMGEYGPPRPYLLAHTGRAPSNRPPHRNHTKRDYHALGSMINPTSTPPSHLQCIHQTLPPRHLCHYKARLV